MRILDLPPEKLCRQHLLGEHRELHAVWTVLTEHKKGYSRHPETLRWVGKLKGLYARHERLVEEMQSRGYSHHSPLNKSLAKGTAAVQDIFVDSPDQQKQLLKAKKCGCQID